MNVTLIMPVYNEADLLPYSLETPLAVVDEAVIIDGSPWGPSTDRTPEIIREFQERYPGKIEYVKGTYRREDGSWAQDIQRNTALEMATGDCILLSEADMIFRMEDLLNLFYIAAKYSEHTLIYFPMIEFWLDQEHIRVYPREKDSRFMTTQVGMIPFFRRCPEIRFSSAGNDIETTPEVWKSALFIPHIFRYHYAWIAGFQRQYERHMRNVASGLWGDMVSDTQWVLKHVLDYPKYECSMPFTGTAPHIMKDFPMDYLSGYAEFIKTLR